MALAASLSTPMEAIQLFDIEVETMEKTKRILFDR